MKAFLAIYSKFLQDATQAVAIEQAKLNLRVLGMTADQAEEAARLAFEAAMHGAHPNGVVILKCLQQFKDWLAAGTKPDVVLRQAQRLAEPALRGGLTIEEKCRAETLLAQNGFEEAYSTATRAKWFRAWDMGGGFVVEFYTTDGRLWAWSVLHETLGGSFDRLLGAVKML